LRLFDKAGDFIRDLDGNRLVWVDSSRFVLSSDSQPGAGFLGSTGSTTLTPIAANFSDPLSNNHGAVALTNLTSDPANWTFVVWTPSGTSQAIKGEPEAWSTDGTKLAVWHYTTPGQGVGGQPTGWVEVLSWPDLRSVVSIRHGSFGRQPMSFDPSGQFLLAPQSNDHSILNLATGAMVGPTGTDVGGSPVWDQASDLVAPASGNDTGLVTTYPISGGPAVTQKGLGNTAVSSTDGSTILFYFSQEAGPVTLARRGVPRTIPVPGPVQPYQPDPDLSPDGSGVVIVCLVDSAEEVLLLVG